MANWKEIQGRIRRAQKSENPTVPLTALYEKTHDAMVAFELARHAEQAGDVAAAGRWYTAAAQGFRRPQWKAKAEEALARLGVAPPEGAGAVAVPEERGITETTFNAENTEIAESLEAAEEHGVEPAKPAALRGAETGDAAGSTPIAKRRRRGRRGGRRHRRGPTAAGEIATPARPVTPQPERAKQPAAAAAAGGAIDFTPERRAASQPSTEAYPTRVDEVPREAAGLGLRGRAGDPGLSSRMALLESQLRRMLASTPAGVDEADRAPAGPGVFLLSDTDLQTHYYVEACQTLRIGIGNLLRTGRQAAGRAATGSALKARLAKHLGISEAKAAKYVSDHCAVRWLQLDDGANLLAHFSIAVLRPVLNE